MPMVLPGDPGCLNPAYPRQKLPRASAGDDLAKCRPETGTKKMVALEFGKRKFQLPGTLLTRSFPESHLRERQANAHHLNTLEDVVEVHHVQNRSSWAVRHPGKILEFAKGLAP